MRTHSSKVSKADLLKFAAERSWAKSMSSGGLDSWSNYSGPDHGNLVVVLGRNRDSDTLAESNFECALETLGGEGKHVEVHSFSHWGCGWFELILVNPKSIKKLRIAYDIVKSLEDYPVLDDCDYSEREHEAHSEYAESEKESLAAALSKHFGVKESDTLIDLAYQLNMECQSYYGSDSAVYITQYRSPDLQDLKQLSNCLDQVDWNCTLHAQNVNTPNNIRWRNSRIFHKIKTQVQSALSERKAEA